jgi:hypothetical protein
VPERRCARDSPGVGVALQGKFWDAVPEVEGDISDREVDSVGEERWSEGFSPRRMSARSTLEGFITRAEELGGLLRLQRRTTFTPGGRGSKFGSDSGSHFLRLGDAWPSGGARRGYALD